MTENVYTFINQLVFVFKFRFLIRKILLSQKYHPLEMQGQLEMLSSKNVLFFSF